MPKAVKHSFRVNEKVITTYGTVELDDRGFVTNLDKLKCTEEQLLELPNFVSGETFAKPADARIPVEGQQTQTNNDPTPTDEDYGKFIKELVDGGAKVNSEGYIDMEVLNGKLREKKWPIVSGTKRKELQDLHAKPKDELKQDGPTVEDYVKAGYSAKNYPPAGYASKSTEEEIAAAVKAEEEKANQQNDGSGQGGESDDKTD